MQSFLLWMQLQTQLIFMRTEWLWATSTEVQQSCFQNFHFLISFTRQWDCKMPSAHCTHSFKTYQFIITALMTCYNSLSCISGSTCSLPDFPAKCYGREYCYAELSYRKAIAGVIRRWIRKLQTGTKIWTYSYRMGMILNMRARC